MNKNTDEPEVVNVSGQPSPNTTPVPRARTASATPPSESPGRRVQVEIDADSGQKMGAATRARAEQVFGAAVEQAGDQGQRTLLQNIFGIGDPAGEASS